MNLVNISLLSIKHVIYYKKIDLVIKVVVTWSLNNSTASFKCSPETQNIDNIPSMYSFKQPDITSALKWEVNFSNFFKIVIGHVRLY